MPPTYEGNGTSENGDERSIGNLTGAGNSLELKGGDRQNEGGRAGGEEKPRSTMAKKGSERQKAISKKRKRGFMFNTDKRPS